MYRLLAILCSDPLSSSYKCVYRKARPENKRPKSEEQGNWIDSRDVPWRWRVLPPPPPGPRTPWTMAGCASVLPVSPTVVAWSLFGSSALFGVVCLDKNSECTLRFFSESLQVSSTVLSPGLRTVLFMLESTSVQLWGSQKRQFFDVLCFNCFI
jgi:hypothetical protein